MLFSYCPVEAILKKDMLPSNKAPSGLIQGELICKNDFR